MATSRSRMRKQVAGMATVTAMFPNNNVAYSYFVPPGDTPAVGDFIVTSFSVHQNPLELSYVSRDTDIKSAVITALDTNPNPRATKHYLMLVPLAVLGERKIANDKLVSIMKERRDATAKLDALVKAQNRMELYEELARNNEEAARLLKVIKGD